MMDDADLGLPDVEPAISEPNFFDIVEGGVNISIPPPAASPELNMDSQPPDNILEELGLGTTSSPTIVQEVKYDDEKCEFNEFLLGAPKDLDKLSQKSANDKKEEEQKNESSDVGNDEEEGEEEQGLESSTEVEDDSDEGEEEEQKKESSDGDSDDEDDDEEKETEKPAKVPTKASKKSSGQSSPAIVRLSLPRVQIHPKKKTKESESSSSASARHDDPPQQSTPSTNVSPPRQTRGRLNVTPSSTVASKGKRKISESEEDDGEDEELSVLSKSNVTRSGRETRKIPRFGFEGDSKEGISDKKSKKGNKIKSHAPKIASAIAANGRSHVRKPFRKSEESRAENIRRDAMSNSDASSDDLFIQIPKRGKYFTGSDGLVTHFTNKSGKTFYFNKTLVLDLLRMNEEDIIFEKEKVVKEYANKAVLLEVCIDNFRSAQAAVDGGARRIELCSSLTEGGLTPSTGFLRLVKEKYPDIPVFVMIRPRGGDFVYSPDELNIMHKDIVELKDKGADGFVFGVLTKNCKVDVEACQQLLYTAFPSECTFHRAFDKVADPIEALEKLIEIQFSRILTSGLAASAKEGIPTLKRVVTAAKKRIKIMAGTGVNADNVAEIIEQTGVDEVHGSASKQVKSIARLPPSARGKRKSSSKTAVSMGAIDDSVIKVTDEALVAKIVKCARRK